MRIVLAIVFMLMISGTAHAPWGPSMDRSQRQRQDNLEYERALHEKGLKPGQEWWTKEKPEPKKEANDSDTQDNMKRTEDSL